VIFINKNNIMTVEEFNGLELSCGDTVEIIMNDGTRRNEILYSGNAYEGIKEQVTYIHNQTIPASEPQLLYEGVPSNRTDGIYLKEIQAVNLVSRVLGI
jgi:hypothetical protein